MVQPATSTAPPRSARPYSFWRLVAVTALLISVLGAATAAMLYVSHGDAVREQKISLRNLSVAFAAQTLSVTQGVNQVMDQVSRAYRNSDSRELALPTYFEDDGPARDFLLGIYVFDQSGTLVASGEPPTRYGGAAPTMAAPRVDAGRAPRITITGIQPQTGRGVINFARPIIGSEGRPIGSVLALVNSERFERIYTLVELGAGGSVTLFHRDGTMLVRGPSLPSGIGRSFAHTPLFKKYLPAADHGGFEAVSPIDQQLRLYGYDSVPGFPMAIIVGMDKSDALATWYGRLWTAVGFLGLISLTMIFLACRVARDARRQSKLIDQLAASESRAEGSARYQATILNTLGTPIWVIDGERRIVTLNEAFSRFVGGSVNTLVGRMEQDVLDPDNMNDRERRYQQVLATGLTSEAATEIKDGSGEARTVIQLTSKLVDVSGQAQLVSVLTDITERQRAEERLAYLANFDSLTGLPNQSQFRRELESEVASASARGICLGTIMVSLKRLHEISDLLGQEAGDRALKQVGDIFRSLLPRALDVARIKSAEFAVAVQADDGRQSITEFAIELQRRLSGPLTVNGRDFYLGPVMGVSIFPQDGATADELYRRAEGARNRDSTDEEDPIHFFSPTTHTDLDERLAIEAQLRRALERQEFRLEYQPKVNIADGRIVGFEALLRWTNPVLGAVSPVQFIPIAERTGLIIPIGAWVLEHTCEQLNKWMAETGGPVKVAVNLSPRQFHQKDLLPRIRECVERWSIPGGVLELEITETALVSREQEVDVLMRGIRALGVELSIDDFGTGYSSLAYLKRFPVQRLKVDRAFIRDLGRDEDSAAIIRSVINLARGLKLSVVAEGVETQEQLAMLRAMSCDEYQGFLFSRPVHAGDVVGLIERNRALVS